MGNHQTKLFLRICGVVALLFYGPPLGRAETYEIVFLQPTGFVSSEAYDIADGQQVGTGQDNQGASHILLWSGTGQTAIDMNSNGFDSLSLWGVSAGRQVGYGAGSATAGEFHALLWAGGPQSVVDLNPLGFTYSAAFGHCGAFQVGYGAAPNAQDHALLWSGTRDSVKNLHPSGFDYSQAWGVSDKQQVGFGAGLATAGEEHALLWAGSADSAIDLHPLGYSSSYARDVADGQQVGYAVENTTGATHALMWSSSAPSAADLHPSGFAYSMGYGVAKGLQVGYGAGVATDWQPHALRWSGSAQTMEDLHDFLPSEYVSSCAYAVDASGNIVGTASSPTRSVAVIWKPLTPAAKMIPADMDILPHTLNLASEGVPVTCHIRLGAAYSIARIDPSSLLLMDVLKPLRVQLDESAQMALVKFDRSEVQKLVVPGEAELTVKGKLLDGTPFEGKAKITVINQGKAK